MPVSLNNIGKSFKCYGEELWGNKHCA